MLYATQGCVVSGLMVLLRPGMRGCGCQLRCTFARLSRRLRTRMPGSSPPRIGGSRAAAQARNEPNGEEPKAIKPRAGM